MNENNIMLSPLFNTINSLPNFASGTQLNVKNLNININNNFNFLNNNKKKINLNNNNKVISSHVGNLKLLNVLSEKKSTPLNGKQTKSHIKSVSIGVSKDNKLQKSNFKFINIKSYEETSKFYLI